MFAAHRTDKLHILRMHASRISVSGRPLLRDTADSPGNVA